MRILPYMPLSEGYEPGFVSLNQDEGVLEISHPAACQLQEDSKIVADTLILRCTIRPLPCHHRETKVHLISENIPLESTFLYDVNTVVPGFERHIENSQWQAIVVDYAGLGEGSCQNKPFTFYGKTLPLGHLEVKKPLYLKPFCTEVSPFQLRVTTMGQGQVLTSPPGLLNTRILRGYGGYYHPGVPLAEIEQIYYSLTPDYDRTKVRLYPTSFLKSKGISPPLGGWDFSQNVCFSPTPREEESLSFAGAIAAGYAHLSVHTEYGILLYNSFLCEPLPGHPKFINIHFKTVS